MPNWCLNRINIICKDNEVLTELKNKIEFWTSFNYCENGFGLDWLGNIVGNSGLDNNENGDFSIRCRGRIIYLEQFNNELNIDTETAWSPHVKMWKLLVDKLYPDKEIDVIFTGEEGSSYTTNDPELKDNYIIDSWCNELDSDWKVDKESLIERLQELLGTSEKELKTLTEMLEESNSEVNISQWEYVDWDNVE